MTSAPSSAPLGRPQPSWWGRRCSRRGADTDLTAMEETKRVRTSPTTMGRRPPLPLGRKMARPAVRRRLVRGRVRPARMLLSKLERDWVRASSCSRSSRRVEKDMPDKPAEEATFLEVMAVMYSVVEKEMEGESRGSEARGS